MTRRSSALARVAVDATPPAATRASRVYYHSTVVDAAEDAGATPTPVGAPPRHGLRVSLSLADELKVRKTSALLTRTSLHALVQPPTAEPFRHKFFHAAETASSSSGVRRWLRVQIKTTRSRALLYSVVLLDVVALALDERTGDAPTLFTLVDVLCTLLLMLEVVLKSLAFGWVTGPTAYFSPSKRLWRALHVLLLVLSLLSHACGHPWRILRGLKTVRCLTLTAGLRRILRSLARAVPFLANVATLALFFLFAFAIFGLEAYRGTFRHECQLGQGHGTASALPRQYCSANESCVAPLVCGVVASSSSHINFDSGVSSLFLVFLVVAQDGWVGDIMQPVVEATSRLSSLFFVAIVASMVFLVVNLFVAVITTSFMNFSVDASRSKDDPHLDGHSVNDATRGDDASSTTTPLTPARGSMVKMDPVEEATRVSLIMGATLAIEESIHQQQQPTEQDRTQAQPHTPHEKPTAIVRLLARTRHFHSLHDFTVDATLELLQKASPVDELLLAQRAGPRGSTGQASAETGSRLTTAKPADTATSALADAVHSPRRSWRHAFERAVLSKRFDDAITGCIVVNTAFLLVEFRDMPAWVATLLSISEYFFGAVFLGEMLARIVALRGLRRYLASTERCFDFIVVVCTSVNMVLNNLPDSRFSGLNSVSSLRTLRVGRLMLKWDGTRKLIESVLKSSRGVLDVVAFLILFQVVTSIWAMQLFGGGHLTRGGVVPRWNFDSFPRAFLTLLQVITADQWASIAYDAVDADDSHALLVPFLILIFIVGQYVLLNLFIAVILENFAISEEEAYQLQLAQIIAVPKELDIYEKIEEQGVRAFGEMEQLDNVSNVKLRMFLGLDGGAEGDGSDSATASTTWRTPSVLFADRVVATGRQWCQRLATSSAFHRVVQLMILVSCVTLVLDEPHPEMLVEPPSERRVLALRTLNRLALAVFLVDFAAKVGAHGFGVGYLLVHLFRRDDALGYVATQAYIEDKWNQLDCVLLTLTLADELAGDAATGGLTRVFRAGRVLRPLRILNHHDEMKQILSAVAHSLPHVGNVFGLCAIVYVIFGVVGRSLFSGRFFACNDPQVQTMDACVGVFQVALDSDDDTAPVLLLTPRVWQNARFSFDNIGAAFLTLLEMTSLKWIDKTFLAMDIAGPGAQPSRDASPGHALFFVLFVYLGALFVIRLFVGVLVEQFQRNNGTQMLTESQKSWVDLEKFVLLLKPQPRIPRPRTRLQNALYELCEHRYFARAIAVAILLNVALLLFNPAGKTTAEEDPRSTASFEAVEMLFLGVFLTEALLKTLAFRHYYVLSATGAFELLILGGSLAAYALATGIHGLLQAGRVFRMMRVLRFVRLNKGVYAVFQTFRASLRPIGHIFFLLLMIFFIFAVVGRQLFGGVRLGDSMNRFSNFRTFGSSFLLLFQIMAGDDWHLTMTDCMRAAPFCVDRENAGTGTSESDCGSPAAAVLYFVTYITLVVFFLLNLFIAVVLENFRSCYLQNDVCPISLADFETYRQVFAKYDVDSAGAFPLWQLGRFLSDLPPGLRVEQRHHRLAFLQLRSQAQALLESWQQQRSKRPFFNELLRALCIHQLGIRCLPYEQQRDRVKQIFIYKAKVAEMLVEATMKGHVQRWRQRRERARMDLLRQRMVPETALAVAVGRDRAEITTNRMAVSETVAKDETEVSAETRPELQQQGPLASSVVQAEELSQLATQATQEDRGSNRPHSQRQRSPHKHHHRHKHKKKSREMNAEITPGTEDATRGDPPTLVPKHDHPPLYAPRRQPKMTHKVVPTG